MKNKTLLSLLVLSLTGPMDIAAKGKIEFDEIKDSIWTLTQNASQSRLRGDGQVLYFMSGDAFHTYTARRDQEWDTFQSLIQETLNTSLKAIKFNYLNLNLVIVS